MLMFIFIPCLYSSSRTKAMESPGGRVDYPSNRCTDVDFFTCMHWSRGDSSVVDIILMLRLITAVLLFS